MRLEREAWECEASLRSEAQSGFNNPQNLAVTSLLQNEGAASTPGG